MSEDTIGWEWDTKSFLDGAPSDRASLTAMSWISYVALSTQMRFKLAFISASGSCAVHFAVLVLFDLKHEAAQIDFNGLGGFCIVCAAWCYHSWAKEYDHRCDFLFLSKVGNRMTNLKQRKHKVDLSRLTSGDAAAASKSCTIWCGGIPQSMIQSEKSEAMLTEVFAKYGDVVSVTIRRKPGNKSWAFVTFCLPDSVEKCFGRLTTIEDEDGQVYELAVKAADVDKKLKNGATGALSSMWNNQVIQVKDSMQTPMESILEILEKVAVVSPSTAPQIGQAVHLLTTSDDLWKANFDAKQGMDDLRFMAAPEMRRRPSQVANEETEQFLLSHANMQAIESKKFSEELVKKRAADVGRRRGSVPSPRAAGGLGWGDRLVVYEVFPKLGRDQLAQLVELEEKIDDWDYDIIRVAEITNGRPLQYMLCSIFERYDLRSKFKIDKSTLQALALAVDEAYSDIPYHGATHGADVLQAVNYMIRHHMIEHLSDVEIMACLLAATVHDISHPGVSNGFHVEVGSPLALLYNDQVSTLLTHILQRQLTIFFFLLSQAVNENHHLATAFSIFQRPECDITKNMEPRDRRGLRSLVIRLVLATDLTSHFDYLKVLNVKLDAKARKGENASAEEPFDAMLWMEMCMKMSDVANGARSQKLYNKWSEYVLEEFYLQGDKERSRGIPVSGFMDRNQGREKELQCQRSFLDYIVSPLYTTGTRIWPELSEPQAQLSFNRASLDSLEENEEEEADGPHMPSDDS